MRYIDSSGEEGSMPVGAEPVNLAFSHVVISYEDVSNPYFLAWFLKNIHCRFVHATQPH